MDGVFKHLISSFLFWERGGIHKTSYELFTVVLTIWGATTLSIMTFSIMALNIMTLSIITFSIMTVSIAIL
jgi:hypothetical protein